jgi:hypothetical protein
MAFGKRIDLDPTPHANELKRIIDSTDLVYVLNLIAQICYARADHLRQDCGANATARSWEIYGEDIEHLADKLAD